MIDVVVVAVVLVAVGEDLLDQSVFLAHFHLQSDPFAWQAPCVHHIVAEAEAAGSEADLEIVVELAAEAVGLEAGLELVVDQDVVEAIVEVVAAKEVAVSVAVVEVLGLGPVDDVGLSLVDILKAASVIEHEVLERAGVQGAELLELEVLENELLELADEGVAVPGDIDSVVEGAFDQV